MQTRHILGALGGTAGAILSTCGLIALSASVLTDEIVLSLFFPMYLFLGINYIYDNIQDKKALKLHYEGAQQKLSDATLDFFLLLMREYLFRQNIKNIYDTERAVDFVENNLVAEENLLQFSDNNKFYFSQIAHDRVTLSKLIISFQGNINASVILINKDFIPTPGDGVWHEDWQKTLKDSLRPELSVLTYVVDPLPMSLSRFTHIRRGISNFLGGYGCFAGPCAGTFGAVDEVSKISVLALYPYLLPIIFVISSLCGIVIIISAHKSNQKRMWMRQLADHYLVLSNLVENKLHAHEKKLERDIGFKMGVLHNQQQTGSPTSSQPWRQRVSQSIHSIFNKLSVSKVREAHHVLDCPEEKDNRNGSRYSIFPNYF